MEIEFRHSRECSKKRRFTLCAIRTKTNIRIGYAICGDNKNRVDKFEKSKGRKISQGRASKNPFLVIESSDSKFNEKLSKVLLDFHKEEMMKFSSINKRIYQVDPPKRKLTKTN
jgi:hypothetical protein